MRLNQKITARCFMSLDKKRKPSVITVIVVIAVFIFLILYFIYPIYLMFSKQNVKMKEKLFTAISEGDVDRFSGMFCSAAKSAPDFNENVTEIFDLLEGQFTDESWRYIRRSIYSSESYNFDFGRLSKLEWTYTFKDIPTAKGKTYDFYVRYSVINDSNPQYIGINFFSVSYAGDDDNYIVIGT